jgi:hypothetical protein
VEYKYILVIFYIIERKIITVDIFYVISSYSRYFVVSMKRNYSLIFKTTVF